MESLEHIVASLRHGRKVLGASVGFLKQIIMSNDVVGDLLGDPAQAFGATNKRITDPPIGWGNDPMDLTLGLAFGYRFEPSTNFKGNVCHAKNPVSYSDAGMDEHSFVSSRKFTNTIHCPGQRGHRHRLVQTKCL